MGQYLVVELTLSDAALSGSGGDDMEVGPDVQGLCGEWGGAGTHCVGRSLELRGWIVGTATNEGLLDGWHRGQGTGGPQGIENE